MTEIDRKTQASRLLLSVEDAADRHSLARTRLYALIKTGDIVSVRVGRLRRVPVDALAAFTARLIAEQAAGASSDAQERAG